MWLCQCVFSYCHLWETTDLCQPKIDGDLINSQLVGHWFDLTVFYRSCLDISTGEMDSSSHPLNKSFYLEKWGQHLLCKRRMIAAFKVHWCAAVVGQVQWFSPAFQRFHRQQSFTRSSKSWTPHPTCLSSSLEALFQTPTKVGARVSKFVLLGKVMFAQSSWSPLLFEGGISKSVPLDVRGRHPLNPFDTFRNRRDKQMCRSILS